MTSSNRISKLFQQVSKSSKTLVTAILLVTIVSSSAQAFGGIKISRPRIKLPPIDLRNPTQVGVRVKFRNETNLIILVVMDNNRESHLIAPKGTATFTRANLGDAPTFRILDGNTKAEIFSRRVGSLGTKPSFGFNGHKF